MPRAHEATLRVAGRADDLAEVLRWVEHDLVREEHDACVIRVRSDELDALVANVAMLAVWGHVDVTVEGPPEVAAAVAEVGQRLHAA